MTDLEATRKNPEAQFFDILSGTRAVMLGLSEAGNQMQPNHLQPMAPQTGPDERVVWFFTKTGSDLARAVMQKSRSRAQMCVVSDDHDYHASVNGHLFLERDREVVERFWSPVVSAWFENGRDDPELAVLRFEPAEAQIWASTGSGIRFAWEIAKANLTGSEPDMGEVARITFSSAGIVGEAAE
ncbi:general stress protein 26 [Hoeflea marina]|uniref:General stress protein 26 n=1 Tax=Hoeflea marina TaxID=274592 RepID=A0A317PQ10_9HYPH|nr:pyridoxamine 5'-phosphate oxidase family protein [Hoeflea marina]PWW02018.1 general stress protein 26 [Hoeflea marina]